MIDTNDNSVVLPKLIKIDNAISDDLCNYLLNFNDFKEFQEIQEYSTLSKSYGKVHTKQTFLTTAKEIHFPPLPSNILEDLYLKANKHIYNFDLGDFNLTHKLLRYNSQNSAYFNWHFDTNPGQIYNSLGYRTYSMIIILNDQFDGGDLTFRNSRGRVNRFKKITPKTAFIFPSSLEHKVDSVTSGYRTSLITFLHTKEDLLSTVDIA